MSFLKQLRDRQLLSAAVARSQRPKRKKAVYIIRLHGLVKIGKSVRPQDRIKKMQLPAKPEWVYISWPDDADEEERRLHTSFASYRKHGEWFDLTQEQVNYALKMLAKL